MNFRSLALLTLLPSIVLPYAASQVTAQTLAASASAPVPPLIPYSGQITGRTGQTSATFLIFKGQTGGEPLFIESQLLTMDETGRFKVQLGAANPSGLPSDLFTSGEARWLEVQIAGEPAEPRILLASVPYALKAADAATLGGLPASAFALAGSTGAVPNVSSAAITTDASTTVTTIGGTANQIAKFSGANTIVNSLLYDNGTDVGIGTTAPSATLTVGGTFDVVGASTLNGQVALPAVGTATASAGYDSQSLKISTSAYNSSSKTAIPPRFLLQAEPTGNNTASPNATLNLLASATSAYPSETGLYFNTNGTIKFAAGQTFPATASTTTAVDGTSSSGAGVAGTSSSNDGVFGTTAGTTLHTAGVFGIAGTGNTSGYSGIAGVWGDANAHVGILGTSTQYEGVEGFSAQSSGVYGQTDASSGAVAGVFGYSSNNLPGVRGESMYSSGGYFTGGTGQDGTGGDGATFYGGAGGTYGGHGITVYGGETNFSGTAIVAYGGDGADDGGDGIQAYGGNGTNQYTTGVGIYAMGGEFSTAEGEYADAASLDGNVSVSGTLSADAKDFKIDHPNDPANKYLVHSSIESSEMVNIYSGNVTTDNLGLATVQLPSWFETLNGDLRYQLTVVGRKAQAWVAQEVKDGKFQIASDATNTKVSWQITGVRQDAYAKAHPLVVEETKNVRERGFYKHPELYGQPEEKSIDWVRHPGLMARVKADKAAKANRLKPSAAINTQASALPAEGKAGATASNTGTK